MIIRNEKDLFDLFRILTEEISRGADVEVNWNYAAPQYYSDETSNLGEHTSGMVEYE